MASLCVFVCFGLLAGAAATDGCEASQAAAGLCDTPDSALPTTEVEAWEEEEAAVLKMELLQSSVLRKKGQNVVLADSADNTTKFGTGAGASSNESAPLSAGASSSSNGNESALLSADASSSSNGSDEQAVVAKDGGGAAASLEAQLITTDHNGNVCMLCGKPLPERTDKTYSESRTDCGRLSSPNGPNASTLALPAVELVRRTESEGQVANAFCELNFAKSCADAVANKDYLYWPKSLDMNSSNAQSNAAWDGRYCKQNGFLEKEIVMLQHDFEGMRSKAQDLCKTKYAKYGIEKLSFMDMMANSRYDDPSAPSLLEAETLAAWNCAMGELGCDLALCAYSFCSKGEGNPVGVYDECDGWHPVNGMPADPGL